MHTRNTRVLALVAVMGCAHGLTSTPSAQKAAEPEAHAAPTPAPCERGSPAAALPRTAELSSADLIVKYGTGLDPYQRQDALWLPHAPVMVNEDFDFGIAMTLDGIGAGIAAKKRQDGNAKSARELANLTLADGEAERLDALRGCGVHVYGVIWTKDGGRELRVITDVFGVDGKLVVEEHGVEVRKVENMTRASISL